MIDVDAIVAVVEEIMTQHWDRPACTCWVCTAGRQAGCHARPEYQTHRHYSHHGRVWVDPQVRYIPRFVLESPRYDHY